MANDTNRIPMPQSPAVDLKTGYPTMPWYRYWNQPQFQSSGSDSVITIEEGGTGQTSASAAFTSLAPESADGDFLFFNGTQWQGESLSGLFDSSSTVIATFNPSSNNYTLSLVPVSNDGVGTLQQTSFDLFGRLAGSEPATTTNLPEGTNLYYTNARVLAEMTAALVPGTNITITSVGSTLVIAAAPSPTDLATLWVFT
jgi:hypothetical protein